MEPFQEESKSERVKPDLPGPDCNILTVDYEDWFHILGHDPCDPGLSLHAEEHTLKLLDLLDRYSARATFFVVGWLALRTPSMLQEIHQRGHSIGSHGYHHRSPEEMTESEFRDDLLRSVDVIERLSGVEVRGYRAPGFGVRNCLYPYLDILRGCGFIYDSSVFPGVFPGRRAPGASPKPYHPFQDDGEFWEVPVSAIRLFGVPFAFSGGGFLRLLPSRLVGWCGRKYRKNGSPVVYYLHPRDLCPDSPTLGMSRWRRLRHYGGRHSMQRKMERLLSTSQMTSVEAYLHALHGTRTDCS